jgi:hypothetical protein
MFIVKSHAFLFFSLIPATLVHILHKNLSKFHPTFLATTITHKYLRNPARGWLLDLQRQTGDDTFRKNLGKLNYEAMKGQ